MKPTKEDWIRTKDVVEKELKQMFISIKINEAVLKLVNKELENPSYN